MKGFPRPLAGAPWELPAVRELRRRPVPQPRFGADRALVVFCTLGAPPALLLAGLLHPGSAPVAFWLAACALFFTGLAFSSRLEPPPPRRVFDAAAVQRWARRHVPRPTRSPGPPNEEQEMESWLPTLPPGLSRADVLEQLAKLREQGDLSNAEYLRARQELLGE